MKFLFSFKEKIGRGKFFGMGILYLFAFLIIVSYTPDTIGLLTLLFYVYINFTLVVKRLRKCELFTMVGTTGMSTLFRQFS